MEERIREICNELKYDYGIEFKDIAARLNVSPSYFNRMLHGGKRFCGRYFDEVLRMYEEQKKKRQEYIHGNDWTKLQKKH